MLTKKTSNIHLTKNKINLIFLNITILLTIFLYWKSLKYGFYFDDFQITEFRLSSLNDFIVSLKQNASRPFGKLLWMVLNLIWGISPTPFHYTALLLHIFCGIALYYLITTIIIHTYAGSKQINPFFPLIVTALFLLHPLPIESIVYPIQSLSVLPMTLFSLLSIIFYINYRVKEKKIFLPLIFLLCFLSSISRETGIVLPVLLWLTDLILISKGNFKKSIKKWPLLGSILVQSTSIFLISSIFRPFEEAGIGFGNTDMNSLSYFFTQSVVIIRYISLVFLPVNQNLDYDFPIYKTIFSFSPFISSIVLCFILIISIMSLKKSPLFSFGNILFFLFLAPTSSIVPIRDVIFEHRMYMPLIGILISTTYVFNDFFLNNYKKKKSIIIISSVIIFFITLTSFFRITVWQNEERIYRDSIKKSPDKARPYINLAKILNSQGELEKAENYLNTALEINPESYMAINNIGVVLAGRGEREEAIKYFKNTLTLKPNFAAAYNNIGTIMLEEKKFIDALLYYIKAIKINPLYINPYINIGKILLDHKKIRYKDKFNLNHLKKLTKKAIIHYNIGLNYKREEKFKKSNHHLSIALKVSSNFPEANNNQGNVLISQGKTDEATFHYLKALAVLPNYAVPHYNLSIAYTLKGLTNKAKAEMDKALTLDPSINIRLRRKN